MPYYNLPTPEQRAELYRMHDNRCDDCGCDRFELHAHHTDYRRQPDSVLCAQCHSNWHSKHGHGKYFFLSNPSKRIAKMLNAWSDCNFVTVPYVAGWLGFSETAVRKMCHTGELKAQKIVLAKPIRYAYWAIEKGSVVDWIMKLDTDLTNAERRRAEKVTA